MIYERDGKEITGRISPAKTSDGGDYKIGVWVRDSCAGIGTVTYYDETDHTFATRTQAALCTLTTVYLPK